MKKICFHKYYILIQSALVNKVVYKCSKCGKTKEKKLTKETKNET